MSRRPRPAMPALLLLLLAAALLAGRTAAADGSRGLFGVAQGTARAVGGALRTAAVAARGGADSGDDDAYGAQLEQVKARAAAAAQPAIEELRETILNQGAVVEDFGARADAVCTAALQRFAEAAPPAGESVARAVQYDRALRALEAALDAPLQVLYMRQLALLREAALQRFRTAAKTTGVSEYEAMLQADAQFAAAAEKATRPGAADWDFAGERSFLQAVMNNFAETARRAQDAAVTAAQQQQTAMQFLQSQQQMIQQLQMQLYGQSSPWNVGVAYRVPDTNFNLQGTYQQGRANVQLSCVPDEYAPFLGPNGFTNGVGPGNLGLSLNLSI